MSLYKHVNAIQSGRLVEWYTSPEGKHEIRIHLNGKLTIFPFNWIGDANRKYNELAAL